MNILVVGDAFAQAEFKSKFGSEHLVNFKNSQNLSPEVLRDINLVMDFDINHNSAHANLYRDFPDFTLFLNSVMTTVSDLVETFKWKNRVVGFNGLRTMFDKPKLELTSNSQDAQSIGDICSKLGTDYLLVEDRIGMVTPRVLCMIINEAFMTVQEGTASESDIDLAMKLGTNYPEGPFEMAESIGVSQICQLLDALYHETTDIRYKACDFLRQRSIGG